MEIDHVSCETAKERGQSEFVRWLMAAILLALFSAPFWVPASYEAHFDLEEAPTWLVVISCSVWISIGGLGLILLLNAFFNHTKFGRHLSGRWIESLRDSILRKK